MTFLSLNDLNSFNEDQEALQNEEKLNLLGGVKSLEKTLETNYVKGICGNDATFEKRRVLYGRNEFPEPESQTWLEMFFESFADTTLIVLITAAVVSLAVGLYEDPSKGWIEGAAILFAVVLVAIVTASNNYSKESQFRKLNAIKDDITVGVVRNGISATVNVKELVVGDIVRLNAGDKVPADGVLVEGSDLTCNESALTGESDEKRKTIKPVVDGGDIFLISGATVSAGYCHMLVTAVGENSRWGRTKAKLVVKSAATPLQEKLDVLAGQIGQLGMAAAAATFLAMMCIWYFVPASREEGVNMFEYLLKAFIMAVTIVVVAVPEGLPLAVTLSLAFSAQKMMMDNNLIRVLSACETMGNATTICSDKTGTLTENKMTVVQGWAAGRHFLSTLTAAELPTTLVTLLADGISVNSTAVLITPPEDAVDKSKPVVNGSSTEGAMLQMLSQHFQIDYAARRANTFRAARGDRMFTFASSRKCMSTLVLTSSNTTARTTKPISDNSQTDSSSNNNNNKQLATGILFLKGAAEVVLSKCTHYINHAGDTTLLDAVTMQEVHDVILKMASGALRTVALTHKHVSNLTGEETPEELECDGFVLDAVLGIMDPLRPDVKDAVSVCQAAGIVVRMVTGDNLETARAIAKECGILTDGGVCMEGPAFRRLTPAQLDAVLPRLQVLARSSPDDKHMLVTRLNGQNLPENEEEWLLQHPGESWEQSKDLLLPGYAAEWAVTRGDGGGEVVGVTGDGTNDGPALKAADVGLSMGLSGTDVAKEASDIVILDDNFSSIVKAVMWGRSVFDNIRKFLQFQLTVNVVALTLTFLSALTGKEPPLNAVMMLWVNLIMDTMGALALGTEPPSPTLLQRRPYKRNASLISNHMLRNIGVQFFFQMAVLAYLLFLGANDFDTISESRQHFTIVFNTFVFCQVFNELNARSINDEMNVFKGLYHNPIFVQILIFTVAAQFVLVEYGGEFVRTQGLTADQWWKCALLGALSLPLGGLMRLIPVRENQNDFATPSTLTSNNNSKNNSNNGSGVKKSESKASGFSRSFTVWLLVVTLVPVLVYTTFGTAWANHWSTLLQQMQQMQQQHAQTKQ